MSTTEATEPVQIQVDPSIVLENYKKKLSDAQHQIVMLESYNEQLRNESQSEIALLRKQLDSLAAEVAKINAADAQSRAHQKKGKKGHG